MNLNLNRGISTPIAITIIVSVTLLLVGGTLYYVNNRDTLRETPHDKPYKENKEEVLSQVEDCGTSKLFLEKSLNTVLKNSEQDKTFNCFGNNILNDCKKTRMILNHFNMGEVVYEIEKKNSECMLKTIYGDANQIIKESDKVFANMYKECSIKVVNDFIIFGGNEDSRALFSSSSNPGKDVATLLFIQDFMMLELVDSDDNVEIEGLIRNECSGPAVEQFIKIMSE